VLQLTFSGALVLLLDETLQKGWGLGSGMSLFIAVNICETIAWKAMSPATIMTPYGSAFEGAIPSFFHQLFASSDRRWSAITEAFYRPYGANLTNLLATALVFAFVIYLHGFKVELVVKPVRVRGQSGSFPIKLFYTSNMPIILYSALVSNLYFFSQLLFRRMKGGLLVTLLGTWQELEYTGESYPVGGLAYYLSPPTSILAFLRDPIRAILYVSLVTGLCAFLSKQWVEVSGEAPKDVAKRLRDQGLTIQGHRDGNLVTVLQKHIPPCAQLGGALIGLLTVGADLVGCIGSGTGIMLAVSITYGYMEQISKENAPRQKGSIML